MKHNRFSKWIERLLVLLPLFYVAISSAYVIFNKNAKDSYSGNVDISYKYDTNDVNTSNDLIVGNVYRFDIQNDSIDDFIVPSYGSMGLIFLNITSFDFGSYNEEFYIDDNTFNYIFQNAFSYFYFYFYDGGFSFTYGLQNNAFTLDCYTTLVSDVALDFSAFTLVGDCVLHDIDNINFERPFLFRTDFNVVNVESVDNLGLNNVMTYSMSEFNKLGFGKLDFTSWFTSIFMSGNTNNVYVQFVNSYLNYFLMVECVYFIPMIIYWFIHFGESVVDKFINKGDNW